MVRRLLLLLLLVGGAVALPRLDRRGLRRQPVVQKNKDGAPSAVEKPLCDSHKTTTTTTTNTTAALGVVGLLGGTLTHLVLGSFYCVPNLASYMRPQLQYFKGAGSGKPDALYSMALTLATSSVVMPAGAWLATQVSAPGAALAGGIVVALSALLASYATKCWQFVLAQGCLFGIGHALGYTSPMITGWRIFPRRRGLVSGTILTGFGAAAFVWNPVITLLINPDNAPPPFPDAIADRLAPTLRKLAVAYLGVTILGVALLSVADAAAPTPRSQQQPTSTTATRRRERSPTAEALANPAFWQAWGLCFLSASAALNVAALWKGFAVNAGAGALRSDDRALALAGAISALGNGFGRFFFATASDVWGLGPTYLLLLVLQIISMLALGPAALSGSPTAYAVDLGVVFFVLGGIFSMSPPLASALFGPVKGPQVYGFLFSAFPVASIGGQLLTQVILEKVGWHALIRILAAVGTAALVPLWGLFPRLQRQ